MSKFLHDEAAAAADNDRAMAIPQPFLGKQPS